MLFRSEGIAALAGIYTAPLAPGHFAAGAAFIGVGALAGVAGSALTPSAPGAAPAVGPASSAKVLGSKSANDNAGPQVVNHYYAPVIGGRTATDAEVGARMDRYTDATAQRQQRARA